MNNFFIEIKKAFSFAWPLIFFQSLNTVSSYGVAITIAKFGVQFVAAYSVINTVIMVVNICGYGLLNPVSVFLSKNYGGDNHESTQKIFSTNFYLSNIFSIFTIILFSLISFFLRKLSQPESTVIIVKQYLTIFTLGVFPYFWGILLLQLLISAKKTKISLYTNIIRIVLTFGFIFLLAFGFLKSIHLGMNGVSLAIVMVNWMLLPIFIIFIIKSKLPISMKKVFSFFDLDIFIKSLKIGFPIGITLILELMLHLVNSIYAGQIRMVSQAVYLLFIQCIVAIVVIPFAISQCVSVGVSYLFGSSSLHKINRLLSSNLVVGLFFVLFACGLLFYLSKPIILLFFPNYIDMPLIERRNIHFIINIAIILLIVETVRLVIISALRGLQDVNIPLLINVFSFLIIGVYSSYYFAFSLNFGVCGLALGELLAVVSSTLFLFFRFFYFFKKHNQSLYLINS